MITSMQSADNPSLKYVSFGKRVNFDKANIVPCTLPNVLIADGYQKTSVAGNLRTEQVGEVF